jgi:putative hydrolase of the HAD superfamily
LRIRYWRRYGATLLGLMRHHGTDPRHFLWHTHQFPHLSRMVVAEKGLAQALRRLPGRKVILSNAPAHYTHALLRVLGIAGLFERVFTVESMGFRPKPDTQAYRRMLAALRLDPRRCIMVEDTLENLVPAKRLGMATVWVSPRSRTPACVDRRIASVRELPKIARRI